MSRNGKPTLPVMSSQNWNGKAGSQAMRDTVLQDMRSQNRLKIIFGTANQSMSQVCALIDSC